MFENKRSAVKGFINDLGFKFERVTSDELVDQGIKNPTLAKTLAPIASMILTAGRMVTPVGVAALRTEEDYYWQSESDARELFPIGVVVDTLSLFVALSAAYLINPELLPVVFPATVLLRNVLSNKAHRSLM